MGRRHLYAVVEMAGHELLGTYDSVQQAAKALEKFGHETANASLFNITHSSTPQWVKALAIKAHGSSSADAEIHMRETLVRITSRYTLSEKASSLIMEDYRWVPDLDDYLESMPGFVGCTVEIGDPEKVVVTVDMEVEAGGDTSDPVRRQAYKMIDQLLVDIGRFRWHASPEMKEYSFATPRYTSENFIITTDRRDAATSITWADGQDSRTVEIEDKKILSILPKKPGVIARDVARIEKFAQEAISEATARVTNSY